MSKKPYRCPICRRKSLTRPAMQLHLWAEAIAAETSHPVEGVEASLKRLRDDGLLHISPRTGDVVLATGELGELGEDIRRVLAEIQEEERRDREDRRAGVEQEAG